MPYIRSIECGMREPLLVLTYGAFTSLGFHATSMMLGPVYSGAW